ncbi:MAG: hypothetical protein JWQ79_3869 [Mucilaginibacter sp.]|jgi:transcription initiation factor TFIID subunit TAF12|nr:hypothetical protein [Mucilaginibacter sp.]
MKKIFPAILVALTLNACSDSKIEEKKALDDVINIHDKVMTNDEVLMQNKMKLDTLIKSATDTAQKTQLKAVSTKLVNADSTMEVWMQKFDPEQKGKSHGEIMAYMALQKKQVAAVDSQLKVAVKESNEYLSHFKK